MSLMEKFKTFMGMPEDEYEDDEEMDFFEEEEPGPKPKTSPSLGFDDYSRPQKSNKVVNIHATTQLQVVLVKPEVFEDARGIADHLNTKRTVVLNLESANKEISRRLLDFLRGVAYANDGQIKKVANSTYIITPYNVGIIGADLLDELERNDMFF